MYSRGPDYGKFYTPWQGIWLYSIVSGKTIKNSKCGDMFHVHDRKDAVGSVWMEGRRNEAQKQKVTKGSVQLFRLC